MVSLASVASRFEISFQVIEGGSGNVVGVLSETEQGSQPSYVFVSPRHVLRVRLPNALREGMVIRTPSGDRFIVGHNGPSEGRSGTLFQSYRLFEPTGQYLWQRRSKTVDPVTNVEREGAPVTMGTVWAALEQIDREQFDSKLRASFEIARFITGANVQSDDLIDGRRVTRSDVTLGLRIGTIQ